MERSTGEKNFGKAHRNPFLKAKALEAGEFRCARCGCPLDVEDGKYHLHHRTYDHACIYESLVKLEVRGMKRGQEVSRVISVPPCQECHSATPAAFCECLARLIPLCAGCHFREHESDIAQVHIRKALGETVASSFIRDQVTSRFRGHHQPGAIRSRVITLRQGNINNNHIYLHDVLGLFPLDAIGGSSAASAAKQTVRINWGGGTVETDIAGDKKIFRKRHWLGIFFSRNRLRAGDQVVIEQLAPYSYRLRPLQQSASPHLSVDEPREGC